MKSTSRASSCELTLSCNERLFMVRPCVQERIYVGGLCLLYGMCYYCRINTRWMGNSLVYLGMECVQNQKREVCKGSGPGVNADPNVEWILRQKWVGNWRRERLGFSGGYGEVYTDICLCSAAPTIPPTTSTRSQQETRVRGIRTGRPILNTSFQRHRSRGIAQLRVKRAVPSPAAEEDELAPGVGSTTRAQTVRVV